MFSFAKLGLYFGNPAGSGLCLWRQGLDRVAFAELRSSAPPRATPFVRRFMVRATAPEHRRGSVPVDRVSGASDRELLELAAGSALDDEKLGAEALQASDWLRRSPAELRSGLGLSARAALRLAAALELARRSLAPPRERLAAVRCARDAYELCAPLFVGLENEHFRVLTLDAKHRVKQNVVVSVGTLSSSIVHPREVFRLAVRTSAAALVCVHNHPSGDPEPSAEDLEVTRRLAAVGRTLGIGLLDHVVVGEQAFVSLRERVSW
jgi:DNA repair protein RadC